MTSICPLQSGEDDSIVLPPLILLIGTLHMYFSEDFGSGEHIVGSVDPHLYILS